MWELEHKEGWALNNWCFWTVMLEKTLESPYECKEIKQVDPKGNQSWIFTGRTSAEAEAPVLWSHDIKDWLIGKDPDAGKDWRQEDKGATEDETVGWHHWLTDITNSCLLHMSLSKLQEIVKVREAWHAAVYGVTKSQTRLSHWTTTTHKRNPIRLTADLSAETPQARRERQDIFKVLKGKNLQPRLPRKDLKINGEIKAFQQTKVKRIQYHQTNLTTNVKGTYIVNKCNRGKNIYKINPKELWKWQ